MEGEKWDLYNQLIMDDPTFNEKRSRSYQLFGNMRDAPGGLESAVTADDDPPPRASEAVTAVPDRPPPPQPAPPRPLEEKGNLAKLDLPVSPSMQTVPEDLVPPEYRDPDIMTKGTEEIILSDHATAPCEKSGSQEDWTRCIGHVYMQLAAMKSEKKVLSECDLTGTEKNGRGCALRDIMIGKLQGYSAGWQLGVKQLVKTYLKAYRFGYTEGYDTAFLEGKQKYISERKTGSAPSAGAFSDGGVSETASGSSSAGDDPSAKPASVESTDSSPTDKEYSSAKQAQEQKAREAAEAAERQKLRDDYVATDQERKKAACERKKADLNEADRQNPRTLAQKNADNSAPCDTGAGTTVEK